MHAEVCPVCHGEGKVPVIGVTTSASQTKVCHACGGNGYILVPDEHYWPEPYIPYTPYVPYEPPFPQSPIYICMVIPSD